MLNQERLQGHWNEIQGKIQRKWGQVTEDDLRMAQGNTDELIGIIQRKTGEQREAIEQYLEHLTEQGAGAAAEAAEAARHYAQQAGESVRSGYSEAERMVQRRPAESLAVVFGVGLVAGLIVGLTLRSGS